MLLRATSWCEHRDPCFKPSAFSPPGSARQIVRPNATDVSVDETVVLTETEAVLVALDEGVIDADVLSVLV